MTKSRERILAKMKVLEKEKAKLIAEINGDKKGYGLEPHQRVIDIYLKDNDVLELVIATEQ